MSEHELEFKCKDEGEAPLTPNGQVYRKLFSPKSESVINCALGVRDPIDVKILKNAISNSIMIKHPRFCSLVVRDQRSGLQHWKRTHVNIDDHIFVHHQTDVKLEDEDDEKEAAINEFLADISVSTPLSENKPLWEVHVLLGLNCVVLRVHHSLGDGVSLMSMLSACFGKPRPPVLDIQGSQDKKKKKKKSDNAKKKWRRNGIWEQVKSIWYTIVFMFINLGRLLWVKGKVTVLSGGDGVELWPRKIVTAKFDIHELKSIKSAIPNVTINDVLLGIISSGLSKYHNIKSSHDSAMKQALELGFVIPINLRKDSFIQVRNSELSGWGNKTTAVLVIMPIYCGNGLEPLDIVRKVKSMMDKMKLSYWPQFSFQLFTFVISHLGPKVASWILNKLVCRTTLILSNIVGPSEELVIADNPVTFIKVNVTSISHAITMHVVSYAGKVNLQLMVAKDIIADPELIIKCFQESFLEMRTSIKMNLEV